MKLLVSVGRAFIAIFASAICLAPAPGSATMFGWEEFTRDAQRLAVQVDGYFLERFGSEDWISTVLVFGYPDNSSACNSVLSAAEIESPNQRFRCRKVLEMEDGHRLRHEYVQTKVALLDESSRLACEIFRRLRYTIVSFEQDSPDKPLVFASIIKAGGRRFPQAMLQRLRDYLGQYGVPRSSFASAVEKLQFHPMVFFADSGLPPAAQIRDYKPYQPDWILVNNVTALLLVNEVTRYNLLTDDGGGYFRPYEPSMRKPQDICFEVQQSNGRPHWDGAEIDLGQ